MEKAKVQAEYDTLRELFGLLLQAIVKAEKLELAVEQDLINKGLQKVAHDVEFELGVQSTALAVTFTGEG